MDSNHQPPAPKFNTPLHHWRWFSKRIACSDVPGNFFPISESSMAVQIFPKLEENLGKIDERWVLFTRGDLGDPFPHHLSRQFLWYIYYIWTLLSPIQDGEKAASIECCEKSNVCVKLMRACTYWCLDSCLFLDVCCSLRLCIRRFRRNKRISLWLAPLWLVCLHIIPFCSRDSSVGAKYYPSLAVQLIVLKNGHGTRGIKKRPATT